MRGARISLAHFDADIDPTLAAVDDALTEQGELWAEAAHSDDGGRTVDGLGPIGGCIRASRSRRKLEKGPAATPTPGPAATRVVGS